MVERKIIEFVNKVDKKYKLNFAVLFGSRARGDNLISSDYDILFVSDDFGQNFFERIASVMDFWKGKTSIEPICYTTKEFESLLKQYNPIVWECLKDGVVLVGKNNFEKYKKVFERAVKRKDIIIDKGIKFRKEPEEIFSDL
ncbi:MAG: nucleotidyltransferase domain-containing protein [Candidatus Anstonellales archaeon]